MSSQEQRIVIVGADRVGGGVLIHFSDDTSTLFHSQFLYDVRNQDHNVPILEEGNEAPRS